MGQAYSKEIKQLEKEIDKAYKYIENFVYDYCKDEKDREEFFKNLDVLMDNNLEIRNLRGR